MGQRPPCRPLTSPSSLHLMSCKARSQRRSEDEEAWPGLILISRFSGAMEMKRPGGRQITEGPGAATS